MVDSRGLHTALVDPGTGAGPGPGLLPCRGEDRISYYTRQRLFVSTFVILLLHCTHTNIKQKCNKIQCQTKRKIFSRISLFSCDIFPFSLNVKLRLKVEI